MTLRAGNGYLCAIAADGVLPAKLCGPMAPVRGESDTLPRDLNSVIV